MPAPRILIVDDQRDITRMLRTALETLGRGYVIVDVPSAEEALLEMRRGLVDLLITDLRLPGISGIELIQRLRKASTDAAMIVISAYADEIAQAEITALGAAFYAKPLSLAAFLQGVQHALVNRVIAEAPDPAPAMDETTGLADRLIRLRRDLGAGAAAIHGHARYILFGRHGAAARSMPGVGRAAPAISDRAVYCCGRASRAEAAARPGTKSRFGATTAGCVLRSSAARSSSNRASVAARMRASR